MLRRLVASRTNRPPLSLSKIVKHHLKKEYKAQTVVFVGTVTDDERQHEVPKMTIAALRFTESARARIVKAGGKCMTLDQLVMAAPEGKLPPIPFTKSQAGKDCDTSALFFLINRPIFNYSVFSIDTFN